MRLYRIFVASICVVVVLTVVGAHAGMAENAKKRRKIRVRKRPAEKDADADSKVSAGRSSDDGGERAARLVGAGAAFKMRDAADLPRHEGEAVAPPRAHPRNVYPGSSRLAIPYELLTDDDLLALEEEMKEHPAAAPAAAAEVAADVYPYPADNYRRQLPSQFYYHDYGTLADEKSLGQTVGGFAGGLAGGGGEDYSEGGGGILETITPILVTGILAFGLSSVFANQVTLNSTSNDSVPSLWQLPDFSVGRRRKRSSSSSFDHYDNALFEEASSSSSSSLATSSLVSRLSEASVLYSLAEQDAGCRRKIACVLHSATASGTSGLQPPSFFSSGAVGSLLRVAAKALNAGGSSSGKAATVLREMAGEFARVGEGEHPDDDCSRLQCRKCFAV